MNIKKFESFSKYVKYPRTMHLPWSLGMTSDDKLVETLDNFIGQEVVVTEKLDGENTTIYNDHIHARSLDSKHHPSRNWVKGLWGSIQYDIPEGFRICGENMYTRHSIAYNNLKSYFYVFSIWENDTCLSWDDTVEWCTLLGLEHVPVLYRGQWDEEHIKTLYSGRRDDMEGYVVRLASDFNFNNFDTSVVKFVRDSHVTTDQHWMHAKLIKNELGK